MTPAKIEFWAAKSDINQKIANTQNNISKKHSCRGDTPKTNFSIILSLGSNILLIGTTHTVAINIYGIINRLILLIINGIYFW